MTLFPPTIEETIDRDVKPSEVYMQFATDADGLLFRAWWENVGLQQWRTWAAKHGGEYETDSKGQG